MKENPKDLTYALRACHNAKEKDKADALPSSLQKVL